MPGTYNALLQNPSFEQTTGVPYWSRYGSGGSDLGIHTGARGGIPGPHHGTYYAAQATASAGGDYPYDNDQTVDVSAYAADIDAGWATIDASIWGGSTNDTIGDTGVLILDFLNGGGGTISSTSSAVSGTAEVWSLRSIVGAAVPSGTRTIRFRSRVIRDGGSIYVRYAWDDAAFALTIV